MALLTYHAPIPPSLGFVDAAALPRRARDGNAQPGPARRQSWNEPADQRRRRRHRQHRRSARRRSRGARVIGTASTANHDYLRFLGAEPVMYGDGMAERVRSLAPGGVDTALDVAGSGVLPVLIDLAGGPRSVVTLADFEGGETARRAVQRRLPRPCLSRAP